ncbi:MAG: SDR family NAD(P)-dependent oxidoreductase [Anaerolineae bacterium]
MFKGKVALVTGGAHRVGQAIALALAQAARTSRSHTTLRQNRRKPRWPRSLRAGVRSIAVQCDQQSFSDITRLYETLRRNFDRLDILINSAAIMEVQPALDVTPADWERVINTNLRGPFFIAQAAAKWMLADGRGGSIVNVADLSALHPWSSYVTHTISKSGVVAMTEALALALAPSIRVNAVAPGTVLKPPDWSAERWQKLADSLPLRRAGSPHDVADAVLYCLRSAS